MDWTLERIASTAPRLIALAPPVTTKEPSAMLVAVVWIVYAQTSDWSSPVKLLASAISVPGLATEV